jgi:hypothetical protein
VDLTFDKASGTFRHRTDPDVEAERDKVAQDLVSAKRVAARAVADRKPVTRGAAAGPLAVLVLK